MKKNSSSASEKNESGMKRKKTNKFLPKTHTRKSNSRCALVCV